MRSFVLRQGVFGEIGGAGRVGMQGIRGGGIGIPECAVFGCRLTSLPALCARRRPIPFPCRESESSIAMTI